MGHGLLRESAPLVASPTATKLRDEWREASMRAGWTFPDDWWSPAIDAVTEALVDARDPMPGSQRLGRHRGSAGVGLGETLDDIGALMDIARDRIAAAISTRMLREVAVGWAEVTSTADAVCVDPLTGLVTPAYLRTRLAELYRDGGRAGTSPAATHALVVVSVEPGDRLQSLMRPLDVAECLRLVFSGGETLCGSTASYVIALVDRDDDLGNRVAAVHSLIESRLAGIAVRVWVEGLPSRRSAAQQLVDELGR